MSRSYWSIFRKELKNNYNYRTFNRRFKNLKNKIWTFLIHIILLQILSILNVKLLFQINLINQNKDQINQQSISKTQINKYYQNIMISRLIKSQLIQQKEEDKFTYEDLQIPSEMQILQMFQKNGFRSNNVVTRNQLKELFDRQYAMNNLDEQLGQKNQFNSQLFDQIWGHLELLSDSSAKIQNIGKVLNDALRQLQKKIQVIDGPSGLSYKYKSLDELQEKQQQLTNQMDLVDGQYQYHQENIKSQRNTVRMNIGKLKSQIKQIERDRKSFLKQFRMIILTIGEHEVRQIDTKFIEEGLLSMIGLEKKEYSSGLQAIFILTIICFIIELFVLSYRLSFFTIMGLMFCLYILFLGYYTDKSVIYLIIYLGFSLVLDLGYSYINIFTSWINNPIVFTSNTFLKYAATILILVSVILRILLMIKLSQYSQIPKTIHLFNFWGQNVQLNRRNKQFTDNQVIQQNNFE